MGTWTRRTLGCAERGSASRLRPAVRRRPGGGKANRERIELGRVRALHCGRLAPQPGCLLQAADVDAQAVGGGLPWGCENAERPSGLWWRR